MPEKDRNMPKQPIASPVTTMSRFDPQALETGDVYKLLVSTVIPRPIAFVSTINNKGEGNLAPFSWYNAVSSNPACIMFCVAQKGDGSSKDTLRNILETKQFVVNSSHTWFSEALVQTSANYPYGIDEMKEAGFTPIASEKIRPWRVKEAAIHFECELHQTVELGSGEEGTYTIVIGKILLMHIADAVLEDGRVNPEKLAPLARLGGISYAALSQPFQIKPPVVK